ncbi:hypothetical protein [Neptuniibacter sp. QD37_11]|uniref:hypothetical protein n=1 Tax=Neptuniibacter sp. QD37_11 TaxID=3398209 RepID=UPI0039F4FE71
MTTLTKDQLGELLSNQIPMIEVKAPDLAAEDLEVIHAILSAQGANLSKLRSEYDFSSEDIDRIMDTISHVVFNIKSADSSHAFPLTKSWTMDGACLYVIENESFQQLEERIKAAFNKAVSDQGL